MKPRILVVGNYTFDIVNDKTSDGGSPIYSSLGIKYAGGIVDILSGEERAIFKIDISDSSSRKLILMRKGSNIDLANINHYSYVDGILINPVCQEVKALYALPKPLSIDLQGFVRNCIESHEIENSEDIDDIVVPAQYLVAHANYDEVSAIDGNITKLIKLGFKELLISYGRDGFDLITYTSSKWFPVHEIGNFEIGNGDFLLGAYFTFRLKGYSPIDAASLSKKLVEDFSNLRLH